MKAEILNAEDAELTQRTQKEQPKTAVCLYFFSLVFFSFSASSAKPLRPLRSKTNPLP